MVVRFVEHARAIVRQAEKEAEEAGSRLVEAEHLLLGVLAAQAGTVPRALALAGVDQADLAAQTRQALERTQP